MKSERLLMVAGTVLAVLAMVAAIVLMGTKGGDAPFIGGPFRLESQTGEIVDSAELKGRAYAIFFGFTHCPEVCPTTMLDMQRLFDRLGPEAKDFKVYFVSVDPERDTPEVLRSYLAAFEPHMVGLTGTPDQIAKIARDFRVYYKKIPTGGGDYTMDHTAVVYLMDRNGEFADALAYQEQEDRALSKMRALLRN
jgi:protein SCO1